MSYLLSCMLYPLQVPKSPRPERSLVVGGAVVRGLREGVAVTTHDLLALRRLRHASHGAMVRQTAS